MHTAEVPIRDNGEFPIVEEQTQDQFDSKLYSYCFIKSLSHTGLDNLGLSFHGTYSGRGSTCGSCMTEGVVECLFGLAKLNVIKGCDSWQSRVIKTILRILHLNYSIQSASA